MNCYDWIDAAKNYAESILQKYIELCNLDLKKLRNSENYQTVLNELRNMVDCEHSFYSLMEDCELDFIHKTLLTNEEVPSPFSIMDVLLISTDRFFLDDLIWDRVYKKIVWYKMRKDYPLLSCDTKQVGMLPLLPYQETNDIVHYTSKIAIVEGCFNMDFSRAIFQSEQYSSQIKSKFLYFSSYCDMNVENYYLQTQFTLNEDTVNSVLDFYQHQDLGDCKQYYEYCLELFRFSYLPYVQEALEYSKEDLDQDLLKYFAIVIVQNMLYSYMNVVPLNLKKKIYDMILQLDGNIFIKNYFLRKIEPLIDEKTTKIMDLSKRK